MVEFDCLSLLRSGQDAAFERLGMCVYSWNVRLFAVAALSAAWTTAGAAQTVPAGVSGPAPAVATQAPPGGPATQAAAAPDSVAPPVAASSDDAPQGGQTTRQGAIEQEQATKAGALHPYVPNKGERIFQRLDAVLSGGMLSYHPFFDSAYSGGGFTLGMGKATYVGAYNFVDVRGSYTLSNYKRLEAEFVAPRMFNRRGHLSLLGGWRDATQVGFYGIGNDTSKDDRANYRFKQPYGSALFTLFPTRHLLLFRGGVEYSQWATKPGEGSFPSVDEVYTPDTLPGLGAEVDYLHSQGAIGLDWRTSPGYTRRGGFWAATLHDYRDQDDAFSFQFTEYEAIQHIPLLRETWVLSFRGRIQHASETDGQQIPYFMLPSVGGGSSLRGFSSRRFKDQNSLLMQGEWRIPVNRYLDLAFFYDTGKVAPRTKELNFKDLHDDYGFGVRFHGPFSTPLRVEVARSPESRFSFIFSTGPSF